MKFQGGLRKKDGESRVVVVAVLCYLKVEKCGWGRCWRIEQKKKEKELMDMDNCGDCQGEGGSGEVEESMGG